MPSWGAGDDTVVVGTVGRLVAEKGYVELFEAMRGFDALEVTLVVVGGPDAEKSDALDERFLAVAAADGVTLLGHRDDVDDLLGAFDVFVLASHREGQPRAAMEAAATGLPIVATNIRGCRQVVDDGVTGLLVPVRSPVALRTRRRDPRRRPGPAPGDGRRRPRQGKTRVRRARHRGPGDGHLPRRRRQAWRDTGAVAVKRDPDALWRIGDRFLVLAHADGEVLSASGPGADIWSALATDVEMEDLVSSLAARYGADLDLVRHDVEAFVDQLRQRGFIHDG